MIANASWVVCPHEPLRQVSENMWMVDGTLPNMSLRRAMTVFRTRDGGLVIHNAIALSDTEMNKLEALGEPTILIVPNGWHRTDAPRYSVRYPNLRAYCPKPHIKKVASVMPIAGSYENVPVSDEFHVEALRGTRDQEGVFSFSSTDGTTLVFCDAVFFQPHLPGAFGVIYRMIGSSGTPRVTPFFRLMCVNDKQALKEHLTSLAKNPSVKRIVTMHAPGVHGPDVLLAAAQRL